MSDRPLLTALALFLGSIGFLAHPSWAQGDGAVVKATGTVRSQQGQPVSGKPVFVFPVSAPGRASVELVKDKDGSFGCDVHGNGVGNPRGTVDPGGNFSIDVPRSYLDGAPNFTVGWVRVDGCSPAPFRRDGETILFPKTRDRAVTLGGLVAD